MAGNKGGSILENVGMLVAPRETQGIMQLPLIRQEIARKQDQGSAIDQLLAGLRGQQPTQDLNVTGNPANALPVNMPMGRSMNMGPQEASTSGNLPPIGMGAVSQGPAASSMANFLRNDVPMLAMRADPSSTLAAIQERLNPKPIGWGQKGAQYLGRPDPNTGIPKVLATVPDRPEKVDTITMSAPGKSPVTLNLTDPADMAKFNAYKTQGYTEVKTPPANVTTRIEMTPENKALGDTISGVLKTRHDEAQAGYETLYALERQKQAINDGLKTGAAAPIQSSISNWLVGLGADQGAVNNFYKLSEGADYDAASGEITRSLIKAFGANPSNADREFAEKMGPQLKTNPQAALRLIERIGGKAKANIGIYKGMIGAAKGNPQSEWLQHELNGMETQYGNLISGVSAGSPAQTPPAQALVPPAGPAPIGKNGKPQVWVP